MVIDNSNRYGSDNMEITYEESARIIADWFYENEKRLSEIEREDVLKIIEEVLMLVGRHTPERVEVRDSIREFAIEMEAVMSKHDDRKGNSWKGCEIEYLETKLKTEFEEWKEEMMGRTDKRGDEVIDIANMCMMLWHRYDEIGEE